MLAGDGSKLSVDAHARAGRLFREWRLALHGMQREVDHRRPGLQPGEDDQLDHEILALHWQNQYVAADITCC
jgi:hypothetical protein